MSAKQSNGRIRRFLADLLGALCVCGSLFIPYALRALFGG